MKSLFIILLSAILLLLSTASVSAADTSVSTRNSINFTSCLTPIGNVIANYESGTHGIVGGTSKDGKDTVYKLENGNAMQCFCSVSGQGIQTNWLKASGYSEDEIKVLQSQGWIYVPTGISWGLTDEPYLAKNSNFSCNSNTNTTTSTSGGDGKTDGLSDGLGSIVQPSSGTNLASTGNSLFIIEMFSFGVFLTTIGLILRIKSR